MTATYVTIPTMTCKLPIFLLTLFFWAIWPVAAEIFKYEDAEGNIVYSDMPPNRGNAASDNSNPDKDPEIIEISEPNTFKNDRQPYMSTSDTVNNGASKGADYAPVEISSPQEDESIRENTGNITVVISGQTALSSDHTLRLMVDGKASTLRGSATFTLTNLDRGTHVLRVDIVDRNQKLVLAGVPRTFHLQRFFVKK